MALVFQNYWWSGSDRLVNEIESESAAQTTRKTIEIEAGSALDAGVGVGVGGDPVYAHLAPLDQEGREGRLEVGAELELQESRVKRDKQAFQ